MAAVNKSHSVGQAKQWTHDEHHSRICPGGENSGCELPRWWLVLSITLPTSDRICPHYWRRPVAAQDDGASKRLRGHSDRVNLQFSDTTKLHFRYANFDGVIRCGATEHWVLRAAGVAENVRVVKPGGPLLTTDADRSVTFDDAANFASYYKIRAF
jgi:SAM-dependent methyltransferase